VTFFGSVIAGAPKADLYLWQIDPPVRLARLIRGLPPVGGVGVRTEIRAYACAGGALALRLVALAPLTVELRRNSVHYRTVRLRSGERRAFLIRAKPRRPIGRRVCSFGVLSKGPVQITAAEFKR
jgi:hypothetical protein